MNALDGRAQQAGNGEHLDLGQLLCRFAQRNGVGDNHLLEARIGNAFDGRTGKHGVAGAGVHRSGAVGVERIHGLHQRSGGVDDVVDDEAGLAVHIADHVHDFGNIDVGTALVDDGQRCAHLLRKETGTLHAACIRRNHDEVGQLQLAEVADQHRAGEQMIDGDVEEALDLRGVQVDEKRAVGAGGGQQIGDELGADGDAGAVLAILAGVSVIRNDHRDAGRGGALECVDHDQQFHQVLVDGIAGGLHDEDVDAADILEQLEVDFAIGKALQLGLAHRDADVAADLFGQRPVGRAAEELEAPVLAQIASPLALGSRFGILRLRVRASGCDGSLPPSLLASLGRPAAACLPTLLSPIPLPSPSTSKLVGFGCIPVATAKFGWATRIRT